MSSHRDCCYACYPSTSPSSVSPVEGVVPLVVAVFQSRLTLRPHHCPRKTRPGLLENGEKEIKKPPCADKPITVQSQPAPPPITLHEKNKNNNLVGKQGENDKGRQANKPKRGGKWGLVGAGKGCKQDKELEVDANKTAAGDEGKTKRLKRKTPVVDQAFIAKALASGTKLSQHHSPCFVSSRGG